MMRSMVGFWVALLIAAGAQAQSVSSTLTMTGTGPFTKGSSVITVTGQATLTSVGSGTFTSTFSLSLASPPVVTGPFTITLSGGTLTGTFTVQRNMLITGAGTGSLTITGGTGSYAEYTGNFPYLMENGSISDTDTDFALSFSGNGTVNTGGGGTTTPTPTIAAVQDAASNTPNIAQGSLFSVYGSSLSPSSQGLTPFPRPTVSGGVKVTFTPAAGGAGTDVYLVYVGTSQINALLPSTVAAGSYNVTVTNGTVSPAFATQVVASKVGLFTQDQSGAGLAVVQNWISPSLVDVNRLTTGVFSGVTISPAKPGQPMIAWGTGLGGYAAGDNTLNPVHDFSKTQTIAAVVGGVSIPVDWAGRNGYAGEDQINFTLPGNIPTGCAVMLQISVNGVLSAPTSIAIAPGSSDTACVQPGYTTQQLQSFDQGATITTGGFSLTQLTETLPSYGTVKVDSISGSITQISGFQLAAAATLTARVTTSGSCQVFHVKSSGAVTVTHLTNLDAGTVTLNGPSGSNLTNQKLTEDASNGYAYPIGMEGFSIPGQTSGSTILPGTYTLTGAGGKDVGTFNTSITLGSPIILNNPLPATVTESAGLTIGWQGGNASDVVEIIGTSSITSGTGTNLVTDSTEFICTTTAGQKTFTVPASILTQLPITPAVQVSAGTASGFLQVMSGVTPANFNASLKADGSNISGSFASFLGFGSSVAYQ